MALRLSNSFEGGTDGTTLTQGTGGNTGGRSQDFFDSIVIGASMGEVFSSTNPAHGAGFGMRIDNAATVAITYVSWSTALGTLGTNITLYGRCYIMMPANPTVSAEIFRWLNGTTTLCGCKIQTDGTLKTSDSTAGTVGTTTSALAANTLYRIEFQWVGIGGGAGVGSSDIRIFLGDSSTQVGASATSSAQNFGSLAPNAVRIGVVGAAGWPSQSVYFDGLQVNDSGFPGAEVNASPPALARNNSEGGTNATTITSGNSGGLSGHAWSFTGIGASATLTYSSTQALDTLAIAFGMPASQVAITLGWDSGLVGAQPSLAGSFAFWLPVNPVIDNHHICNFQDAAGNTAVATIVIKSTGAIAWFAGANGDTQIGTATTTTFLTSTWQRIDYQITFSSSGNGNGSLQLFTNAAGTGDQGIAATAWFTGQTATFNTANRVRLGCASGGGTVNSTFYMDNIVLSQGVPLPSARQSDRMPLGV